MPREGKSTDWAFQEREGMDYGRRHRPEQNGDMRAQKGFEKDSEEGVGNALPWKRSFGFKEFPATSRP